MDTNEDCCADIKNKISATRTTLGRAPVGLLMTDDGTLIMKTEYHTSKGAVQAYIVSSGEMFWGDAPQTVRSQLKTRVRAVDMMK